MSCLKKCYATRKIARGFRKKLNNLRKFDLKNEYFCEECSSCHITSIKRKDFRDK